VFREVLPSQATPPFGAPDRAQKMEALLTQSFTSSYFTLYRPLYEKAREVVGRARSPYAAAVAIESWLRETGGFTYDQHPRRTELPILDFVTRTKDGYCQHFAGAMALMLRYLGIPARVVAGFTTGRYDKGTWTVTDHNAHAWVEAWFAGYGWLPFDPTPGRGSLSASYSSSSPKFNPSLAAALIAGAAAKLLRLNTAAIHQNLSFGEKGVGSGLGAADPRRGGNATGDAPRGGSLGKLVGLLVAAALALVAIAKVARRRARYATTDARRVAAACRAELVDFLADQGIALRSSAAPLELAAELRARLAVDAEPFATAFAAARFGPPAQADAAASRARRELAGLRTQLRSSLGPLRRVRGLVSLRSLGFT
jgi:hypothetical protein